MASRDDAAEAAAAWVAAQVAAGQQEFMARFMLGMYQAVRDRLATQAA